MSLYDDLYSPALTLGTLIGLNVPCLVSRLPRDSPLGSLQHVGFPFNMSTNTLDRHFSFSAKNFNEGRYYTCLTCLFNHIDAGHFNGNMAFLFASGYDLHIQYGRKHVLLGFFGGGIAGCISQFSLYLYQQIKWENILPSPKSWSFLGHTLTIHLTRWQKSALGNIFTRVNAWRPCIGCSAGLAGLLAIQACSNIVSLIRQSRKNGIKIDFNFLYQFSQLTFTSLVLSYDIYVLVGSTMGERNMLGNLIAYSVDGVGHAAHLGGFIFGFLYYFKVIYNKIIPREF